MNNRLLLLLLLVSDWGFAQTMPFHLAFRPTFNAQPLVPGTTYTHASTADSIRVDVLRFYISALTFYRNDTVVFRPEPSVYLVSIDDTASLTLQLALPDTLRWTRLSFQLGIDSATNVSGALGGALDPTTGMYWTWQSGYINVKLEGRSGHSPARNQQFQYHLGGYQQPFCAVQLVSFAAPLNHQLVVPFAVDAFFNRVNVAEVHHLMSPCAAAVNLSATMADLFQQAP